jgi:hypothetical protein
VTSTAPPIGFGANDRYKDRSFEQAEPEWMRDWDHAKGTSKLPWESAKHATREAWQRVSDFVERATLGIPIATGSKSAAGPEHHLTWPTMAHRAKARRRPSRGSNGDSGDPGQSSWYDVPVVYRRTL